MIRRWSSGRYYVYRSMTIELKRIFKYKEDQWRNQNLFSQNNPQGEKQVRAHIAQIRIIST